MANPPQTVPLAEGATTRARANAVAQLARTYRGNDPVPGAFPSSATRSGITAGDLEDAPAATKPFRALRGTGLKYTPLAGVEIPPADRKAEAGDGVAAGNTAGGAQLDDSSTRVPGRGRRRALSLDSSVDGSTRGGAADDSILRRVPTLSAHGVHLGAVASSSRRTNNTHDIPEDDDYDDEPERPDKGKATDPRNWGNVPLRDDERDPAIQRAMLDSYRQRRGVQMHEEDDVDAPPRNTILRPRPAPYQMSATPIRSGFRGPHALASQPINQLSHNSALGRLREREVRFRSDPPPAPRAFAPARPPHMRHEEHQAQRPAPRDYMNHARDVNIGAQRQAYPRDDEPPVRAPMPPIQYAPVRDVRDVAELARAPRVPLVEPKRYNGSANLDAYMRLRSEYGTYVRRSKLPDTEQVEVLSSFLEGKAYDLYLQRASYNPEAWELAEFFDTLFNHCFPRDFKSKLRNELQTFKQGSRTVWEYAHALFTKLETVGLTDERERIHKLWYGFEPHIEESLWRDRLAPETSNWDEILECAEAAEQAHRVVNRPRRTTGHQTTGFPSQNNNRDAGANRQGSGTPATARPIGGPPITNLPRHGSSTATAAHTRPGVSSGTQGNNNGGNSRGAQQAPGNRRPNNGPMSENERQDHVAQGKCFLCHGHGHIARNCREANVVSAQPGGRRPPGMAAFNLEMELEDSDDVLEELPIMSIHRTNDFRERLTHRSDAGHLLRGMLNPSVDTSHLSRDELHEPFWMTYPKRDRLVRNAIGDAFAMLAEYHLNVHQPYPGDREVHGMNRPLGTRDRFGVYAVDDENYGIYDRCLGATFHVKREHITQPTYRLAKHYAQHRAKACEMNPRRIGNSYNGAIGDALCTVASCLLTDGIENFYPSRFDRIDDEDRFCVTVWNAQTDVYAVNDADRDSYTLISGENLRNKHFNLIRWYELAIAGKRGLDAETHFHSPPSTSPAQEDNVAEAPDDQSVVYSDLPALQSISNSSGTVSQSDDLDSMYTSDGEDDDADVTSEYVPFEERLQLYRSQTLGECFTRVVADALARGAPYPGDNAVNAHDPDRFHLVPCGSADDQTYFILDNERNLGMEVPVRYLRNPSFNIGMWYAEHCAFDGDQFTIESDLVSWTYEHEANHTCIGTGFEQRIADTPGDENGNFRAPVRVNPTHLVKTYLQSKGP